MASLPGEVVGVRLPSNGQAFDGLTDGDSRAVQLPNSTRRVLANGLGAVSSNTMGLYSRVDLLLAAEAEGVFNYELSLYFCDFNYPQGAELGRARRQGVTLHDYATRNPVAPFALVTDFADGVWLRFRYNRSTLLKFHTIQGDTPVLSAILFD